eukprot:gnl/MRDRNA2_/MRDRNA2_79278_c0_seq1.p1 gnl/MRDRNA2_/MRDRNA2_79278_c0~~gnl/MRDRNA2_/MRDRNA2_79278_c0_seq1.p1  ORF type:complete len:586 (+),score=82.95 gnl/MRDRNA2_/MRDRNA2_79278_c0_seq1:137-1894(+)
MMQFMICLALALGCQIAPALEVQHLSEHPLNSNELPNENMPKGTQKFLHMLLFDIKRMVKQHQITSPKDVMFQLSRQMQKSFEKSPTNETTACNTRGNATGFQILECIQELREHHASFSQAPNITIENWTFAVDPEHCKNITFREQAVALSMQTYLKDPNKRFVDFLMDVFYSVATGQKASETDGDVMLLIELFLGFWYQNPKMGLQLRDCGWGNFTITVHDRNGHVIEKPAAGWHLIDDQDAMGVAVNVLGNNFMSPNTCAVAFSAADDSYDFRAIRTLRKFFFVNDSGVDEIVNQVVGSITTKVSGAKHAIFGPLALEYAALNGSDTMTTWRSLAASSHCEHILMTGISLGSALSQIHFVDSADLATNSSKYVGTCYGKPCALLGSRSFSCIWYGDAPVIATRTSKLMLEWFEMDTAQTILQNTFLKLPVNARSALVAAGVTGFNEITNITIVWKTRDLVLVDGDLKRSSKSYEVPEGMSTYDFQTTFLFQDRMTQINSWGPLVSKGICGGPSGLAPKTGLMVSDTACAHGDMLAMYASADLDGVPEWSMSYMNLYELSVPLLQGSVFFNMMRLARGLRLISD